MGWALPIDQYAIEPLHDGIADNKKPAAFGIYRRNQHGWYRITQRTSEHAAQVKLAQLRAKDHVQTSDTTRPDEA
jgi:hypothetical protein